MPEQRPRGGHRSWESLFETTIFDTVDEATDVLLVSDERAHQEAADRLAHVLVRVLEALGRPPRADAGLIFDLVLQRVADQALQAAVGVMQEKDLARAQQA